MPRVMYEVEMENPFKTISQFGWDSSAQKQSQFEGWTKVSVGAIGMN